MNTPRAKARRAKVHSYLVEKNYAPDLCSRHVAYGQDVAGADRENVVDHERRAAAWVHYDECLGNGRPNEVWLTPPLLRNSAETYNLRDTPSKRTTTPTKTACTKPKL